MWCQEASSGYRRSLYSSRDIATQLPQFTSHPEWFQAFISSTNQKSVQAMHLVDNLKRNYPRLNSRVGDPNYSLRILMIGAGVGTSEIMFLEHLKQTRGSLANVAAYYLDPSPQMQDKFREAANRAQVSSAVVDYKGQRFEDPTYKPEDVDLALVFQTWHYVNNWRGVPAEENSLVKLASSVEVRNGVAVVSIQSLESDNYTLRRVHIPAIHRQAEVTSEDIAVELTRLAVTHDHLLEDSSTDLTSLFRENKFNPTQKGRDLLSFLLRVEWDVLDPDLQRNVAVDICKLVSLRGSQKMIFRDGYVWIPSFEK